MSLSCMLKPQQIPGFLVAFSLRWMMSAGSAAEEVKLLSESLFAVPLIIFSFIKQQHWDLAYLERGHYALQVTVQY